MLRTILPLTDNFSHRIRSSSQIAYHNGISKVDQSRIQTLTFHIFCVISATALDWDRYYASDPIPRRDNAMQITVSKTSAAMQEWIAGLTISITQG